MSGTPVAGGTGTPTDEQRVDCCRGCGTQTANLTWNHLCTACNLGHSE